MTSLTIFPPLQVGERSCLCSCSSVGDGRSVLGGRLTQGEAPWLFRRVPGKEEEERRFCCTPPSHCGQLSGKHVYPALGRGGPYRKSLKKLEKTFLVDSMTKDNIERGQKDTGSQTQEGCLACLHLSGAVNVTVSSAPSARLSPQDCAHNCPVP